MFFNYNNDYYSCNTRLVIARMNFENHSFTISNPGIREFSGKSKIL